MLSNLMHFAKLDYLKALTYKILMCIGLCIIVIVEE